MKPRETAYSLLQRARMAHQYRTGLNDLSRNKTAGRSAAGKQHINASAPDRNAILACLEEQGRPLKRRDLVAALGVDNEDSLEIMLHGSSGEQIEFTYLHERRGTVVRRHPF